MKILTFLFSISIVFATPSIEREDRQILEPFFKYLLKKEDLGYVLLGEKPALFVGYVHHLSWKHPFYSLGSFHYYSKGNQKEKLAWEVWKKYSSRVSDRFLFKEEVASQPLCMEVFIINRDCFCKVVNENREIFEQILERKISGEELLEEIKIKPFLTVLKKHESLLGIILGYGKNNSLLYSQKKLDKLGFFPKDGDNLDAFINLPTFRADWNDPESLELRNRYLKCREKIKSTFFDHDPFDQMMQILFEGKTCHTK